MGIYTLLVCYFYTAIVVLYYGIETPWPESDGESDRQPLQWLVVNYASLNRLSLNDV